MDFLLFQRDGIKVVTLDKLAYAASLASLEQAMGHPDHCFVEGDISDRALVRDLLVSYHPDLLVNFAAESSVDRSIDDSEPFVRSNVFGAVVLLDEAKRYWQALEPSTQPRFRFLQVSTDEVYGSLGPRGLFNERRPYRPSSPYAASKAAADHFALAYHKTFGLPVLITHSCNNFGPRQHPEKLIPKIIARALEGMSLPVYGDGSCVREWLYVADNCAALAAVLERGAVGEAYCVGGGVRRTTLQIVGAVCDLLDEMSPSRDGRSYRERIDLVKDRPGHDIRYAVDTRKLRRSLGWRPRETLENALRGTVKWYLANREWW